MIVYNHSEWIRVKHTHTDREERKWLRYDSKLGVWPLLCLYWLLTDMELLLPSSSKFYFPQKNFTRFLFFIFISRSVQSLDPPPSRTIITFPITFLSLIAENARLACKHISNWKTLGPNPSRKKKLKRKHQTELRDWLVKRESTIWRGKGDCKLPNLG